MGTKVPAGKSVQRGKASLHISKEGRTTGSGPGKRHEEPEHRSMAMDLVGKEWGGLLEGLKRGLSGDRAVRE